LGDRSGDDAYLDRNDVGESSDPVEELHDQRFRESLVAAIENLPEREKYVMSMYYEQDMNLKEIGAVLGVTESRISQLHSQAVARIRASLKEWICTPGGSPEAGFLDDPTRRGPDRRQPRPRPGAVPPRGKPPRPRE